MKSAIVLALATLCLNSCASKPLKGRETQLCDAEDSSVFAAVLRESLDPANPRFPEYEIASQYRSIYVVNIVDVLDAKGEKTCIVNDSVLPSFRGKSIKLVEEKQLDRLARRSGGKLAYARLHDITVEGNTATVSYGGSIKYANNRSKSNLCCCSYRMILKFHDSKWLLDRQDPWVCS